MKTEKVPQNGKHVPDEMEDVKLKLLREVIESIMWELDAVRQGRWEDLPELTERKKEFLKQMETFDWAPAPRDRENPELYMIQSQIIDLEYQLRKMIERHLHIFQAQLKDLKERSSRWKHILNPYKHS